MAYKERIEKKITTPRGTLTWCWLTEPDRKHEDVGVYQATILFPEDSDGCKLMQNTVDELIDKYIEFEELPTTGKRAITVVKPYRNHLRKTEELDEEGDPIMEPDGMISFKFKMKASFKKKSGEIVNMRPTLIDSKKNPIPAGVKIGSGSEGRIAGNLVPYGPMGKEKNVGCSLYLTIVQLLKLVEFGGNSIDSFDLDEEEGGYVAGGEYVAPAEEEGTEVPGDF